MKENRILTCILCPMGCEMSVSTQENGEFVVEGNACPRGPKYAISECTNPVRTLTTTIRCIDGSLLAARTDKPIPKGMLMEAMRVLNRMRIDKSVEFGDVLVENLLGTDANVIACGIWKEK